MTQRKQSRKSHSWQIAVIAYRGIVCHVRACTSHESAVREIARYLREHHRYTGDARLTAIAEWIQEREPDFDIQIVEQDEPLMANESASPIDRAIKQGKFIVISIESGRQSSSEYSAWLYEGTLDFDAAFPVRFGAGSTVVGALHALVDELRADIK